MKNKVYVRLLANRRWQYYRTQIWIRDNFHCRYCADYSPRQLETEHLTYRAGFRPWQYKRAEVISVCSECHVTLTIIRRRFRDVYRRIAQYYIFFNEFYQWDYHAVTVGQRELKVLTKWAEDELIRHALKNRPKAGERRKAMGFLFSPPKPPKPPPVPTATSPDVQQAAADAQRRAALARGRASTILTAQVPGKVPLGVVGG
jgi:hypothetical protein